MIKHRQLRDMTYLPKNVLIDISERLPISLEVCLSEISVLFKFKFVFLQRFYVQHSAASDEYPSQIPAQKCDKTETTDTVLKEPSKKKPVQYLTQKWFDFNMYVRISLSSLFFFALNVCSVKDPLTDIEEIESLIRNPTKSDCSSKAEKGKKIFSFTSFLGGKTSTIDLFPHDIKKTFLGRFLNDTLVEWTFK